MKRLPAVAVALAGLVWGGSAEAADMPVKAPPLITRPVPAIPFSWTGIYVGGNAGGSVGTWHAVSNTPIFEINSLTSSPRLVGAVGGGQAGLNWQFAPSWVIGVEADIQATSERKTQAFTIVQTVGGPKPSPVMMPIRRAAISTNGSFRGSERCVAASGLPGTDGCSTPREVMPMVKSNTMPR